jgi:hypothetical protein
MGRWIAQRLAAIWLATMLCAPAAQAQTVAPEPRADWAQVLQTFVDAEGRVAFARLAQDRAALNRYVAWLATHGPRLQPQLYSTVAQQLAFHINAYNALAMFHTLEAGVPQAFTGLTKIHFFGLRSIQVDGSETTLYAYENKVIRALGDERIHFALNCMSVGCPVLPREPFDAATLEAQLAAETKRFFADPRHLQIDSANKVVKVSEILKFFPEDFLAKAPSLLAYIARHAQVPEGATLEFIPYDWTVNRQPGQ